MRSMSLYEALIGIMEKTMETIIEAIESLVTLCKSSFFARRARSRNTRRVSVTAANMHPLPKTQIFASLRTGSRRRTRASVID